MIMLEENGALGRHAATQAGRPRPADHPYKRSPPGSRLLQASIPLLPQFVCSSFCAQNHVDIANLPKFDSSNNTHP
jgi:hypothetical protein